MQATNAASARRVRAGVTGVRLAGVGALAELTAGFVEVRGLGRFTVGGALRIVPVAVVIVLDAGWAAAATL
jgi:hypothetical protein